MIKSIELKRLKVKIKTAKSKKLKELKRVIII